MKKKYMPLIAILLLIIVLYFLFDEMASGAVLSFLDTWFFYQNEYIDASGILHQTDLINWINVKKAILLMLLCIATICYLIIKRNTRKARKADIQQLEDLLQTFQKKEKLPVLGESYVGIEKNLLQIRNEQEEQIRMLELQTRQKNDLISYLAHDMKTPLASVIGYLNLLNDVKDVPQQQKEHYIEITLDKANRLELLIDEFFDITRFNLHDIVLTPSKIELSFLFQQLCEQFYPITMKQDKLIELHIESQLYIYADADKLARALNNILKNAISYSYEHSTIMIEASVFEEEVYIQFHNQGDEIPQQKLQMIFEKFYRLDKARSTNVGGAGLGLAIAKEIIEAHSGSIRANSSIEETVFSVVLPMKRKGIVYEQK